MHQSMYMYNVMIFGEYVPLIFYSEQCAYLDKSKRHTLLSFEYVPHIYLHASSANSE